MTRPDNCQPIGLTLREHRICNEGIGAAFLREIARLTMTGNEDGIAAERPQLARNRVDQVLMIAHREIGAADRSLENHIADNGELRRRMVEHDMARRVARAVAHLQSVFA